MFGFVNIRGQDSKQSGESVQQQKSKILFSESRLRDFERKVIARNSIDRFSAATRDGALYTENTVYNGSCSLDIMLQKDISDFERVQKLIFAVIRDLHKGYLAVGGLTSIGRGMFCVERITVDGEDMTDIILRGGHSA